MNSQTYDVDEIGQGYLDSEPFQEFTVLVHEAIDGPSSVGDIKRRMGDEWNPRWAADALAALEGLGAIRRIWGIPTRWAKRQIPLAEKSRRSISPAKPADKTKPSPDSFY